MNKITEKLLTLVSDFAEAFVTAYNIREDGQCAGRQNSEFVTIENKEGLPGIEVRVKPFAKNEVVYIPACVTHSGVDDLVYNDFYIGEGADVKVVAGCGVHSEGEEEARHNGVHRFFVGKGAKVTYEEKHVGTGEGAGGIVGGVPLAVLLLDASCNSHNSLLSRLHSQSIADLIIPLCRYSYFFIRNSATYFFGTM